jgi:uncharacterized protein (TIGR02679 family)
VNALDSGRLTDARRRFGRPELAPLWAELRRRLETSGGVVSRVRVGPLDPAQRVAVADLLGLDRLPSTHVTVPVAKLDAVLRASPAGMGTREVVEALGGPLVDGAAERMAARHARAELWAWLEAHPQVAAEPSLGDWAAYVRAQGVVGGSVSRTRALLKQVFMVLAALPADGRPLPSLASAVTGDPHALDEGTRLAAYLLRAVATLRDQPAPADAAARRALWQRVGVADDMLSPTALVGGLRPNGDGLLAATLRAWADAGQACAVTLAQLQALPLTRVPHPVVWVVENPSVLAEGLRRFGVACPPVVCTSGWPNGAVITLLRQVAGGGAGLRYHGDLDGEGLRIAAHVAQRTGAQPWRMTAGHYLGALRPGGPRAGRVTEAPWDSGLAAALRHHDIAVPQEDVCDALLAAMADGDTT